MTFKVGDRVKRVELLIPGTYDGVKVRIRTNDAGVFQTHVDIKGWKDADELTRAAAALTALAGALRDDR